MIKAIFFAIVFVFVGGLVFGLLAPLLFRGADLEKIGEAAGAIILIVGGTAGFAFGWHRRKKV